MLELEYQPQLVNRVSKLTWEQQGESWSFTLTHMTIKNNTSAFRPRYGCACWSKDQKSILIMGGVFNDANDFLCLPPGITRMQLLSTSVEFKQESKAFTGDRLKPKMFYSIQPSKIDPNSSFVMHGGFGRDFTNMFSLFSCYYYEVNFDRNTIKKKKHPMRVIHLPGPLHTRKVGQFSLVS